MEAGAQADMMKLDEDRPVRPKEPRWEPATHPRGDQASPSRRYFPFKNEIVLPASCSERDWSAHQQPPDEVQFLSTLAHAQDAAQDAAQGASYGQRASHAQETPNERWVAQEPRAPQSGSSGGSGGVMLFGCNISVSPPASRDFQNPCGTAEQVEHLDSLAQRRAGRAASYSTRETAISSNPALGRSASARISTPAGVMSIDDRVNDDAANAPQLPTSNSYPTARIRSQHNAAYYTLATDSAAAQPGAKLASASASANLGIADGRSAHPWGVAAANRTSAEINPADVAFARRLLETHIRGDDDATLDSATDPSRLSHTREMLFQEAASRSATDFRDAFPSLAWSGDALDSSVRAAESPSPAGERLRLVVQALQDEPPSLNPEPSGGAANAAAERSGFAFGSWPYTPAALQALLAAHAANAASPRVAATAPPEVRASAEVALSGNPQGATGVAVQRGLTLNPPSARLDPPAVFPPAAESIRRVDATTTAGEAAPLRSSPTRRNAGNDRGGANTTGDGSTSATGGALLGEMGDGVSKTVSPRRRFRCTVCDRRFSSGQALGGHSRMHAMQQRAQEEMDR
ncbi:unnamed protein product [Closterium sp. Yama58-4]|nr:unnamed protein product [Closterium sp. Yama58-4]